MKEKEQPVVSRRKPRRKAMSAEEREAQMIALTLDVVEERIRTGKASSQELCHYLRASSMRERYEAEKTRLELELVQAKTENLRLQQKNDTMYADALRAFKRYKGIDEEEDDTEDLF